MDTEQRRQRTLVSTSEPVVRPHLLGAVTVMISALVLTLSPTSSALAAPAGVQALSLQNVLTLPAASPTVTKQTTANLNLRATASTGSKVLLTIPKGAKLRVLGTSGKWIKLTYKSKTGWASGDFLKTVATPKPKVTKQSKPTVTKQATANLHIRAKASTSSKVLVTIPKGTKLSVLGTSGKWVKLTFKSKTGWASGDFLKAVATPVAIKYRYTQGSGAILAKAASGSTVLLKLTKGTKVELLRTSGVWSNIRKGTILGWIDSKKLGTKVPAPKPKTYRWTTAMASVSLQPNSSSKRLGMLGAKTKVEYLKASGLWRQVKTTFGTGWVLASQLSDKAPVTKQYRWTTSSVNVRKGASTSHASRGLVPAWEKVVHHRISGGWSEVTTTKGRGWVKNTGLSKVGPYPVAVYGTLRPGQRAYQSMLQGKTTREARTLILDHNLYIDGRNGLSYILPETAKATGVVAYRMSLKKGSYSSTVARLDAYERYDASKPAANQLYVRQRVTDSAGNSVWAYVGGSKMSTYLRTSGTMVSTGDYLKRF